MRRIVCDNCGKYYDFDKDEFCPKCGAFNQPVKVWGTDDQGNVIRLDGVNEKNHAQSFVHSEVHKEKRERRREGLDQGEKPASPFEQTAPVRKAAPPRQSAPVRPAAAPRQSAPQRQRQKKGGGPALFVKLAFATVAAVVLFNFFMSLLAVLTGLF